MDPVKLELPDRMIRALEAAEAEAALRAAMVDTDRVASRVLQRLAAQPAETARLARWLAVPRLVAVAATVVVLAVAAGVAVRRVGGGPGRAALALPVPGDVSDSLIANHAEALLQVVDSVRPRGTVGPVTAISLDDLNEQELRALLQAMQSDTEGEL